MNSLSGSIHLRWKNICFNKESQFFLWGLSEWQKAKPLVQKEKNLPSENESCPGGDVSYSMKCCLLSEVLKKGTPRDTLLFRGLCSLLSVALTSARDLHWDIGRFFSGYKVVRYRLWGSSTPVGLNPSSTCTLPVTTDTLTLLPRFARLMSHHFVTLCLILTMLWK